MSECHKFNVSFPFSGKIIVLKLSGTADNVSTVRFFGLPLYPKINCPFLIPQTINLPILGKETIF